MKTLIAGLSAAALLALAQQPTQPTRPAAPPPKKSAPPVKPAPKASTSAPSYKDLQYPPLKDIVTPAFEPVTLPNGMRLYLVEDHSVALISGVAMVRTGNLFDPADRVGLAAITGQAMRTGGTQQHSLEQINVQLENIAGAVDSSIGETYGRVGFSGLAETADKLLPLFAEVLTAPDFKQDRFEQVRAQFRASITRSNEDVPFVTRRELANALFGRSTPYGWAVGFDGVDRITRADVQKFYQRYYFPKNTMLAVWGDFDSAQMKTKIEQIFAGWKAEQDPVPAFPKVGAPTAPATYLVKKSGTNTQFDLGLLEGDLRDPDAAALEVAAQAIAGGPLSRLGKRLRQQAGGAVQAGSVTNYDHPGIFEIAATVPTFQTVKAIRATRAEVAALRSTELPDDELAAAKERALIGLAMAFDTKSKMMDRLITLEYFGYPRNFTQQYQKALEAVTRADVMRVAKDRLDPEKFTMVVAGNPVAFDEPIERLGGTVVPLDLVMTAPKPLDAAADESARQRGKDLLQRAQTAAGGADHLAAVKDFTLEASFQFGEANGKMQVSETDRWLAPGYFRQDSVMPSGKISAYLAGDGGWIVAGSESGALKGTQLKQVQGDQFRAFFPLLMSDRAVGRVVKAVDDVTVEISDTSGQTVRLVMDPKTGLPQNALYDSATAAGTVAVTETYSDYRDVSGLKMPFHISISAAGGNYAEVTVKSFQANTGLQQKDLEKKP